MAYTTLEKILESGLKENEVIHLLNDEERDTVDIDLQNSSDPIVIRANKLIEKADAFIDSHLRGRFNLPLTITPAMIEDISTEYSIILFYEHRHRKEMPETLLMKKQEIIKTLEKIQRGSINPGIEDEGTKSDQQIRVNKTSSNKIFTDDFLEDF
ncbi:MAG: DUF1320 domain-containing protein [Ignavibacteriaceae bacterium]